MSAAKVAASRRNIAGMISSIDKVFFAELIETIGQCAVTDEVPLWVLLCSSPRKRRSSLGSALSGCRTPDQKALFNDADNGVDDDDKGRKHKHAGENPRHVEYSLRLLDQIAEAGSRAQVFAHDRAHDRKADRGV